MKTGFKKIALLFMMILILASITGCAGSALGTKIKFRELVVNADQGKEIFIPKLKGRIVAVRFNDATGYNIGDEIKNRVVNILSQRGYVVVPSDSPDVNYTLRVKLILKDSRTAASDINKTSPSDGGIPGAIGGAVVGAAATGDLMGGLIGAGVGAVVGTTASQIADNMVQVHTLSFKGEILVDEKLDHNVAVKTTTDSNAGKHTRVESVDIEETDIKSYRGDFVVTAQQEGLKWEKAKDQVLEKVALSSVGPFESF